jgi:hypothetical protein
VGEEIEITLRGVENNATVPEIKRALEEQTLWIVPLLTPGRLPGLRRGLHEMDSDLPSTARYPLTVLLLSAFSD